MILKGRRKKVDWLGTLRPKEAHSGALPGFLSTLQISDLLLKKPKIRSSKKANIQNNTMEKTGVPPMAAKAERLDLHPYQAMVSCSSLPTLQDRCQRRPNRGLGHYLCWMGRSPNSVISKEATQSAWASSPPCSNKVLGRCERGPRGKPRFSSMPFDLNWKQK